MPAKKSASRQAASTKKVSQKSSQFKPYKSLWRRLALPVIGLFAIVATALVINSLAASYKEGFVYRDGKNLMLNGATYKFVGFNAYGMTGCETGTPWSQAQIDAYFRSLPPASVTRIWAFKQRSSNLDLVVSRAEAHGQKLVMTLGNGLRNCESGTFYTGEDNGATMGTAWFQSGYKGAWMDWVRTAVGKYKNSPAVGMWEVSNEGGHHGSSNSDVSVSVMKPYYDTVSAAIKGIDAQHLVSTGALAAYTYGGESGYQSIHSSANIDVVSFHEYDGGTLSNHFPTAIKVANNLNKPLMVGETGQPWGSITTGQSRADYLKKRLDGYLAGGAVGVLPWNYGQGNYGGWTIFPGDASATMVTNYKVPGGVVVSPIPTPTPTAPTVSVNAPANNATISGVRTVTANASDKQAIKSVQFKLDGNNLGSADTTAPYSISWDTKTVSNGKHTITAVATNTSNLSTTSTSVSVNVSNQTSTPAPTPTPPPIPTPPAPVRDTTAPTAPRNFKTVRVTQASVTLRWDASWDKSGVAGYRVYRDGKKIADQSYTSLRIYGLKSNTRYTFTVEAYDNAGNTSPKAQLAVTTHKAPRRWYQWW
jgi:mannan endo-1,4-beta-mannosidase